MKFEDFLGESAQGTHVNRAKAYVKVGNEHADLAEPHTGAGVRAPTDPKLHHEAAAANYKLAAHYFHQAGWTEEGNNAAKAHAHHLSKSQ